MRPFKRQAAFSLVEFIIVIVITGIIATSIATFITRPVQGFIDLSRRATLVYSAESALRRMQRDIRRALPNSIRVNGTAIEMINTIEGARYRADPPTAASNTLLEFNTADSHFDILGNFSPDTLANPNINHVAVYNIGSVDAGGAAIAGSNAYGDVNAAGNNVITPNSTTINITNVVATPDEDHVQIVGGWQFTHKSPNRRMYLIDTAITYVCNGDQLTRYTNYDFINKPNMIVPPAMSASALMADNIGSCSFSYDTGTPSRSGLMTLDLTVTTITPTGTTESARLLHQVHVDNTP